MYSQQNVKICYEAIIRKKGLLRRTLSKFCDYVLWRAGFGMRRAESCSIMSVSHRGIAEECPWSFALHCIRGSKYSIDEENILQVPICSHCHDRHKQRNV